MESTGAGAEILVGKGKLMVDGGYVVGLRESVNINEDVGEQKNRVVTLSLAVRLCNDSILQKMNRQLDLRPHRCTQQMWTGAQKFIANLHPGPMEIPSGRCAWNIHDFYGIFERAAVNVIQHKGHALLVTQ